MEPSQSGRALHHCRRKLGGRIIMKHHDVDSDLKRILANTYIHIKVIIYIIRLNIFQLSLYNFLTHQLMTVLLMPLRRKHES